MENETNDRFKKWSKTVASRGAISIYIQRRDKRIFLGPLFTPLALPLNKTSAGFIR